jgi:hypothetical protein
MPFGAGPGAGVDSILAGVDCVDSPGESHAAAQEIAIASEHANAPRIIN